MVMVPREIIADDTDNAKPYQVLGLDIGIGSCGWALLDKAGKSIKGMGVRLWETPQEPKTKMSTALKRRKARSARRNTKRTADRKKHCIKLFERELLIPQGADAQWLQTAAKDKPTIKLRARGLDRLLSNREWAQVLYSLCGRRGYIPHGDDCDDVEGKKLLQAIKANEALMKESGWRTVGEMLSCQERSRNKGGDYSQCISNGQILAEIETLFFMQAHYGSKHAGEDFKEEFIDCLTWQKDVSGHDEMVYRQVGFCSYFQNEKRAANACLSSELCKAYERIGHVVIVHPDGTEHALPIEIRRRAIETLFSSAKLSKNAECKVRYSDLREWLDLDADAYFKGVDKEKENKDEPYKPVCWRSQRKVLPEPLMARMRGDRSFADNIGSALAYASSKNSLSERLEALSLSDEETKYILKLNFASRMYNGYGARSLKALDLLIDSFEDEGGTATLTDAERASGLLGYRLREGSERGMSLPPYKIFDKTNENPVVLRVMSQVRKVVNAVILEYGMPDEVHIELARELKRSKKEKDAIHKSNTAAKDMRNALREKIAEERNCEPENVSLRLLMKVELWNEQGGRDLYLDEPIIYRSLLEDDQYCEIDHILPYSRTCDDSRMNKTLVLQKSNQDKKERTPFEWLSATGGWDGFKLRVARLNRYPVKKKQRLLNVDLSEEKESGFIERNLNDTRYASRAAKDYIEHYLDFPDNGRKRHVVAVAGGATAALRNAWGLKKDRAESNLHHAMDAAVIAACDESAVIAIARALERKSRTPKGERRQLFQRTEPWEGFAEQVIGRTKTVVPTYMINRGVTGRVFEDTVYSFKGLNEAGTKGVLTVKGKNKVSGNYVLCENGSAQIVDGLAFLRLWWDPDAEVHGRKDRPGRYFAEPVYYADIPTLKSGEYIPRLAPNQTEKKPRCDWDPVPEELLAQKPIAIFWNDALVLDGVIRRFRGFDINSNAWKLSDPRGILDDGKATKGFAISVIGPGTEFFVMSEDVLGNCFKPYLED